MTAAQGEGQQGGAAYRLERCMFTASTVLVGAMSPIGSPTFLMRLSCLSMRDARETPRLVDFAPLTLGGLFHAQTTFLCLWCSKVVGPKNQRTLKNTPSRREVFGKEDWSSTTPDWVGLSVNALFTSINVR